MVGTAVTGPSTLVQGVPETPKAMELMVPTVAGLPVVLCPVPEPFDLVHVMAMPLTLRTMFPLLTAVMLAGDGLTVQTVEATAEAGLTARANAAEAAPATTARFLIGFFMALGLSLGIHRQRDGRGGGRGRRPVVSRPRNQTLLAGNLAEQWRSP